jgi:hypothetical protein
MPWDRQHTPSPYHISAPSSLRSLVMSKSRALA